MVDTHWVAILYQLAALLALAGILLSFLRMILGPTIADRAVSLDSMTLISISLLVYIAGVNSRAIYMDVALVYGLISFLGVLAVARYLEKGL